MANTGIIHRVKRAIQELRGQVLDFGTNTWSKMIAFMGGVDEDSNEIVTSERGSKLTIIFNCLNIISQDIATLPKQVRQETNEGKKVLRNRLHKVLNLRPNKWENAYHFWYGMIFVGEGWGNSYAVITERDAQGYATEMIRLKPWLVVPKIVDGNLLYVVDNEVVIPSDEMFHYRSMTTDGPIGENKITYNAKAVGLKIKQQKYSSKSVGNKPPGIIFANAKEEELKKIGEKWNSHVTGDNIAGTPVLNGEDIKYQNIMLDPKDADIVLQNKISDEDLMGIWRIQPSMLSKHEESNYNVVEQQNINHVRYALNPVIVNVEQEVDNKLLPSNNYDAEFPVYVKLNVKSLLRGDTKTQTEFYRFLRTEGVANADEIRSWEDMAPQKDENGNTGIGEKYFIQGAMVEIGKEAPEDTTQRAIKLMEEFSKKHELNGHKVS